MASKSNRRARATAPSTRSSTRCGKALGFDIHVQNYHEHGLGSGEDATAVAYVQLRIGSDRAVYGVGFDVNIVTATLRAVVCAANRALQRKWLALQPVRHAVHA